MLNWYRAAVRRPRAAANPRVTVPTLLVWGERDPIIPVEHGLATHQLVPSSRLELFEGAGHFLVTGSVVTVGEARTMLKGKP